MRAVARLTERRDDVPMARPKKPEHKPLENPIETLTSLPTEVLFEELARRFDVGGTENARNVARLISYVDSLWTRADQPDTAAKYSKALKLAANQVQSVLPGKPTPRRGQSRAEAVRRAKAQIESRIQAGDPLRHAGGVVDALVWMIHTSFWNRATPDLGDRIEKAVKVFVDRSAEQKLMLSDSVRKFICSPYYCKYKWHLLQWQQVLLYRYDASQIADHICERCI